MKPKFSVADVFGAVRLYSLADLLLLLYAVGAGFAGGCGAVLLWLAFLFFLEWEHSHPYRWRPPAWAWSTAFTGGCLLLQHSGVVLFAAASFFYATKNRNPLCGALSCVVRGCQAAVLVAMFTGWHAGLGGFPQLFSQPNPYLVGVLITLRNFLGDIRDLAGDRKDGAVTLASLLFGLPRPWYQIVHLLGLFCTSYVWYRWSGLEFIWFVWVILTQLTTYWLTPRK